jgi:2-keto-4-pentenoate hydratase
MRRMSSPLTAASDPAADAAQRLVEARRTRQRAVPPALPDAAAAYRTQALVAQALGWADLQPPRHWKSGGPTVAAQTHAPLPPPGIFESGAELSDWPFLTARIVEAEVALRLGRDVDAALAASLGEGDDATAQALVDATCVSIELCDSRWTSGFDSPPLARLADLQSHAALVLGAWMPFQAHDWSQQACRVRIGSGDTREFRGTHSLGSPVRVLPAWLRHATQGGTVLRAGTVVTCGTWCGTLPAQAGDKVRVGFDGIGEAHVQL